MMSSTVRLGAFILVALIMFGVMVFLIGDKQLLFSRTYHISAPFNNVAGLDEGAPVRAGDTIDSRPPVDYGDVAKKAGEMLETAKDAIDSSKVAIGNVNEMSADLKSITGKVDSGQGTMGALVNDKTIYRNLNATVDQAKAGATSLEE